MSQKRKRDYTISSPLWGLIPYNLVWQLKNRNIAIDNEEYEHIIQSINISILLNLNSMVEGYLKDLLFEVINKYHLNRLLYHSVEKNRYENDKLLERRLMEDLQIKVDNSTWKVLVENFNLIHGKDLNKIVGDEIWEGVDCQFTLRNIIAHGNTIVVKYEHNTDNERKTIPNKKWIKVQRFLSKKNKVDTFIENKPDLMQIFNKDATDFFVKNSIKFIEALNENINNEYSTKIGDRIVKNLSKLKEMYSI